MTPRRYTKTTAFPPRSHHRSAARRTLDPGSAPPLFRATAGLAGGRRRGLRRTRRGASAVEAAIALPVFLWILLAMLDLGIAVLRHNALSDAARRTGREVALHGSRAPQRSGSWGPEAIETTAAGAEPVVADLQPKLPTMPAEDVEVEVSWLDGENRPCDRVQVRFRYTHEPIVPGVLPWGSFELQAATTTTIVN